MRQTYEIEMDDGATFEVNSDARDVRAWEAKNGQSFFVTPLSYTEIAQISYLAGTRTGQLNGKYPTYEEFDAHCIGAHGKRPADAVVNADPTPPDPTVDSSAA